jgi:hypothetical protein
MKPLRACILATLSLSLSAAAWAGAELDSLVNRCGLAQVHTEKMHPEFVADIVSHARDDIQKSFTFWIDAGPGASLLTADTFSGIELELLLIWQDRYYAARASPCEALKTSKLDEVAALFRSEH